MAKNGDYSIVLDDSDPKILRVTYSVKGRDEVRTKDFLRADTSAALRFLSKKATDFVGSGGQIRVSKSTADPEGDRILKDWVQSLGRGSRYRIN